MAGADAMPEGLRAGVRRRLQVEAVDAVRLRRGRMEVEPDAVAVEAEKRLAQGPRDQYVGRGLQPQRLVPVHDACPDPGNRSGDPGREARRHRQRSADVRRCDRRHCGGDDDDHGGGERRPHVSDRPPRATRAARPTSSAAPASTIATTSSVEVPPPPIDDSASIVGAGVSDDSGPDQSTIDPSEYVCRTLNVYVFASLVDALKRNTA